MPLFNSSPSAEARPAWARALRRLATPRQLPRAAPLRCEEPATAAPPAESEPMSGPPGPKQEPPLQFEMFSKEWRQTAEQDNWDGFRIEAATQVTKHLQASHTLFLGTAMREQGYIYQFGPAFQTEGGRTMMVGRIGLDGGVNGRWIQKVGTGFELKASSQSHLKDPQRNMHDASVEYAGKDWTFGAKAAWQGALLAGGSFTQRIVPSLQLGGDLTCVMVQNTIMIGQVGARWSEGGHTFTTAVSRQPDMKSPSQAPLHEVKMQYHRRLNERLCLATEFKFSHPDKESGMSMAYEYAFRNSRVQGNVDTDGKVSCSVFDYQGMGFSGTIDYARGDYKFGVLLQVMPPDQGAPPQ
mmetsp:Transcript_107488/g.272738  ORF Transcript_107488/g.272738 Transcript_107488/m.272738 type:complete len:354 (-) Transcript_107488:195-1256(-)